MSCFEHVYEKEETVWMDTSMWTACKKRQFYEFLAAGATDNLGGNDKMELVMQPSFETCGQACIAMITGKSVGEVIKDMKTNGPTSIGQLMEILDRYGVQHGERNKRISKKNPAPYRCSILTVHTNGGYTHWVVFLDGQYFDPEFGLINGEYTHGKITSFLEIYTD